MLLRQTTRPRKYCLQYHCERSGALPLGTGQHDPAAQSTQTECVQQNPHAVLSLLRCCTPTDMRSEKQDFPTLS
jgi:hypothetical protein